VLVALLGPDILLAIPIDQRAGGFTFLNQKCVAAEMWGAAFLCGVTRWRFRINLLRIHPFEVVAPVPDANARTENDYFSGCTVNDRNPNLAC
jgi:hypothetical protein